MKVRCYGCGEEMTLYIGWKETKEGEEYACLICSFCGRKILIGKDWKLEIILNKL